MASTCHTCGQANADGTEYCVRCGTRMPDPSSTQLVGTGGQAEEYPWEPPAEWDPGDLPAGGAQTPAPTWVATPQDQVGWNTGHDTGAGHPAGTAPQWGTPAGAVPPGYPPAPPGPPPGRSGGSRKPLIISATAVIVIAAVVAVVLVATGGKKKGPALNGVQTQSATDALATARQALRAASSVEIAGTVSSSGQTIRLDLTLAGNNSSGTLTIDNNDVQLIKTDQTVFIKGDTDFLKKYAGNNSAVLNQLNGKWLKVPSTTDFDTFTVDGFAQLLKGGSGANAVNAKVTQSTLNGRKVVIISQKDGSTLDIANTGPAVPLLLNDKSSDGGIVNFSNYNKSVSITAPPSSDVFVVPAGGGTLPGSYTCTGSNDTSGGTLSLLADSSYTVSGGGTGGSWGSSGNQVAFAGGVLDKYAATWNESDTLNLTGSGTNASVSFTCVKQ